MRRRQSARYSGAQAKREAGAVMDHVRMSGHFGAAGIAVREEDGGAGSSDREEILDA